MLHIHLDKLYIKIDDVGCKKFLKLIDHLKKENIDIQFARTIYKDKGIVPHIISNKIEYIGFDECVSYIELMIGEINEYS